GIIEGLYRGVQLISRIHCRAVGGGAADLEGHSGETGRITAAGGEVVGDLEGVGGVLGQCGGAAGATQHRLGDGRGGDACAEACVRVGGVGSAGAGVVEHIVGAGGRGQGDLAGRGCACNGGVVAVTAGLGQPGIAVAGCSGGVGGADGHV